MSKFVFVVPPLHGHVNPTLAVGKALLDRSHEVAWISADETLVNRLPEDGKFLFIEHHLTEEEARKFEKEMSKENGYGLESFKNLYEDVLLPLNDFLLKGITQHLIDFKPDVVITDQQVIAGSVAATKLGIPYATSVTAPSAIKPIEALPKLHEWESKQVIGFQKKHGVDLDRRIDCSSILSLVYTSKMLFGQMQMPSYFKFIGPVISTRPLKVDFDWQHFHEMKHAKKVLVSIGTTFNHKQKITFLNKIKEVFEDEDVTVVVVSDSTLFDQIPTNFIVQEHVPQLDLLPHIDLVICHAGQNTVSESLFNGIPLILLPIAYDQSQVANSVVEQNAGIRLNFNRFRAIDMKKAFHEILQNEDYTIHAERLRASFIEAGGIEKAANYLEKLLQY